MLCPGCFSQEVSSKCTACDYDLSIKRSTVLLPHHTKLNQGRYLVGRVIGRLGGFGVTYLALDTRLQTIVAIKEFLPRDIAGRDADQLTVHAHTSEDEDSFKYGLTRFLDEARTLAKLDHPNIVRVRDFFEENGTAYLVMDYCQGLTLSEYIRRQPAGKVEPGQAVSIMIPILDGLREVHQKGFLHRDIKPQNIYLTSGNRPILLDFGAARQAMGERSKSLSVVLSEGYAPFEQYQRDGKQGPWTDIYGVVATFYTLITGMVPPSAIDRINNPTGELSGVIEFDDRIRLILTRGLHLDYAQRTQSVEELLNLLGNNNEPAYTHERNQREPDTQSKVDDAWPGSNTKAEQLKIEPDGPAWDVLAPYYASALVGESSIGKDPDPWMIYRITSIIVTISIIAIFVYTASFLNEAQSYSKDEAVGVLIILGAIGFGVAYSILSALPSFVRARRYRRAAKFMPIFKTIHNGKNQARTSLEYIFIPVAWLGYWGLWKELAISVSLILFLDASPAILASALGAHNYIAIELYKATDKSIFFTVIWLSLSWRYNKALYDNLSLKLLFFINQKINDPAVIFGRTRPKAWRGAASCVIFLMLFVGVENITENKKGEILAASLAKDGDYTKALAIGTAFDEAGEHEKSAEWLMPLSDKGYSPAQYMVARLYDNGLAPKHAPKDQSKAMSLFRSSADSGYTLAQRAMGETYYSGIGVTIDPEAAFYWFMKAASNGDVESIFRIAYMYWMGEGVREDLSKSFDYMKKAAELGQSRAQAMLGMFYEHGYGVKKNKVAAMEWYQKSLNAGQPLAKYYVGMRYFNGDGVQMDKSKAIALLAQAADEGVPGAQYEIGAILIAGDDVTQNVEQGTIWLKKAAEAGVDDAASMLKKLNVR